MKILLSDAQFIELYNYLTTEERFGPGPGLGRVTCDHTLRHTLDWMKKYQVQSILDNIEKIVDLGGHCDCEVLLNVDPQTWAERRRENITGPDMLGESEWKHFLADLLSQSGYQGYEKA